MKVPTDEEIEEIMNSYKPEVIEALIARTKANGVI